MKKNKDIKRLRLDGFEKRHTRLTLLRLPDDEINILVEQCYLVLGRSERERCLWENFLEDDLIICISFGRKPFRLYGVRVTSKGVKCVADQLFTDQKPFLVFVQLLGKGDTSEVPLEAFFFNDNQLNVSRSNFKTLWERCQLFQSERQGQQRNCLQPSTSDISTYIASSHDDYKFISDVARYHPFGVRKAFLTLIGMQNNKRIGGILVELSSSSGRFHSASWRVFHKEYSWIRNRAISILRIYTSPQATKKWKLHEALLKCVVNLAPSLVEEPISVIEAVSYDYHPVALSLGFNIEVPQKIEGSFYYWKPFNLPSQVLLENRNTDKVKSSVHSLLKRRSNINYWIAPGRLENILLSEKKKAWAIRKNLTNTGRWRNLLKGHIVYLVFGDKYKKLKAYGTVDRTEMRTIPDMEGYPLWIDFKSDMVCNLDIDISDQVNEEWYNSIPRGGLIPIPDEFGAKLKKITEEQSKEGKMWVTPNPYLFHETVFENRTNQIFIIQAWDLRETILPMLKTILADAGYDAKYSGDRDGQVIFDDIWLLLNESCAVLADFTNKRPNVYLEYGMALVLGKPIIAITQNNEDIPSDTPNLKYILYPDKLGDQTLSTQLPSAIKDTIADIQRKRESIKKL